jgi:hypothetical protein
MKMIKINIAEIILSGEIPLIEAIEKSLGKDKFSRLKNQDFKTLAKFLEKKVDEENSFGLQKIYPALLSYALAALHGDKDSLNSMIRLVNKQIHGYDTHDSRLTEIVNACEERKRNLKSNTGKKEDVSHHAVQQDLTHLFDKLNSFEDRILAERLDIAFDIYEHSKTYLSEHFSKSLSPTEMQEIITTQKNAAAFLKMILNVGNDAEIEPLMAARARIKLYRPEYIPRKDARNLAAGLPDSRLAKTGAQLNWRKLSELARAHKPAKMLHMRKEKLQTDIDNSTIMLTPLERDAHRVIIKDGVFYNRQHDNSFEKFDTISRRSHGKEEYIAYTINPEREISVFDHYEIADGYAHSSMNAQGRIIVSGELRIEDGELTHLTVYSMHYRPQEENIFEALKIFKNEGVDLSKVTLRLWDENNTILKKEFINVNAEEFYKFHANIEKENEHIQIWIHPTEGYKEYIHPTKGSSYEIIPEHELKVSETGFFSQQIYFPKRSILEEKPELLAQVRRMREKS